MVIGWRIRGWRSGAGQPRPSRGWAAGVALPKWAFPNSLAKAPAMEKRVEELERELHALKARSTADGALLQCITHLLPTTELNAARPMFAKVTEEMNVQFIYGPWPEAGAQAFAARCEGWIATMDAVLEARHRAYTRSS